MLAATEGRYRIPRKIPEPDPQSVQPVLSPAHGRRWRASHDIRVELSESRQTALPIGPRFWARQGISLNRNPIQGGLKVRQ